MSMRLSTFSPRLDGARADHGQSLGATGFVQAVQACRYESRNSATVHEQDRLPAPESSLFIPPCQDNTITTRSSTGENDPGGPSGPRCNAGVLDMWGIFMYGIGTPRNTALGKEACFHPTRRGTFNFPISPDPCAYGDPSFARVGVICSSGNTEETAQPLATRTDCPIPFFLSHSRPPCRIPAS